ncbi:DUF927 domain-containing protein [Dankookia rubra]|uniref:DUF927 domain-containing protein n=1 Tax=Dankookia rubra TaxID=1442381 RepID=A0A4R5QJQ0_9PROT|nr:DUF927 domain-containing protein [Dankookia rubra]TDH62931.1 DUF927 domain-containing protein [Dankookia rubra]
MGAVPEQDADSKAAALDAMFGAEADNLLSAADWEEIWAAEAEREVENSRKDSSGEALPAMNALLNPFALLTSAEVAHPFTGPALSAATPPTGVWQPQLPAPSQPPEAVAIRHSRHGAAARRWIYRDVERRPLFAVARFDAKNADGTPLLNRHGKPTKEILPYTYGTYAGRVGWHFKAPLAPCPLYGLDRLAARPSAPVLLVEGEKAADAAAALFPDHVAMTWPGGSNAVGKADWMPLAGRSVTMWPDNDAAGRKAAAVIAKAASMAVAASVAVVQVPAEWPDGWDLADPLPGGVLPDMLAAMLAAAEAQPAEDAPPAQQPVLSAEEVQAVVERAANLNGAAYAAARTVLAAELPGVGVTTLDKLRREEVRRRRAEEREAFDALDDAVAMEATPTEVDPPRCGTQVRWPPGFVMRKAGLFREAEDGSRRIAGPFAVLGKTRDTTNRGWGLVLEWGDDDGAPHRELVPGRLIHAEPGALETRLYEGGLFVSPDPGDRLALRDALAGIKTTARVRRVTRCGWHLPPGGGAPTYVLPDGTMIGPAAEPVILDNASPELAARCRMVGTLEGWQAEVAARAVGNPAAAFSIAAAFAGPLLEIAGEPSGGFHMAGPSKTGKTTAVQMGVSVWGLPDKRGALRDWRSTANAMEAALEEASDGLLALDEISQADPRELETAIYQAGNEGGKGRLRADATARARRSWRVLILSTGEVTPAQKAAEAGKGMRAGAEVRLPALRFAAEAATMWPALHNAADRAGLWRTIHETMRRHYGTAARAFLARLAEARTSDEAGLRAAVGESRQAFLGSHLPADAPDQVRSVAARFALVAAAGEMATDMEVLPWPAGEATRAAAAGLAAWLSDQGSATSGEDGAAVQAVRAFIERHGEARFGVIGRDQGRRIMEGDGRPVPNRAGWRLRPKREDEGWRFLFLPEVWRAEVCAGLDPANAARALLRAGLLIGGDGKNLARKEWIPGEGRQVRVYLVAGSILE